LQNAYRVRGYATVSVALPQQQITNGIVKVQITEGRLAEIRVLNNRYFSSNNIMREFPGLKTNSILNSLIFQQQLDKANLNRDRQIYPVIGPGGEPGTTDLELKVKDRLPLHAHLELNNNSTPSTPDVRIDTAAQYNNLWQLNHQLGVQYSFSPEEYKNGHFPFYERPLIANYSGFYRMPLGFQGDEPDQSIGIFGYDEASKRFRPPPASSVTELILYASRSSSDTASRLSDLTLTPSTVPPEGALQVSDALFTRTINPTENIGFRLTKPLPELAGIESSVSAGMDYKNYRAHIVQTKVFSATIFVPEIGSSGPPFIEFPSPPIITSRELFAEAEYLPFSLSWSGSRKDGTGVTQLDLATTFQPANILSSSTEFENAALDTKANGRFVVVTAGLTREQRIWNDWGVRFHVDGQWANEPLLSTEQFAVGGLNSVRGYHEGEIYGDRGWKMQFEPHSPYLNIGLIDGMAPVLVRFFGFFDIGQRFLIGARPSADPAQNTVEQSAMLAGAGFGFSGTAGQHCDFRLQVGVPLKSGPPLAPFGEPVTRAGDPRLAFGFGVNF
jgi:hemolysin activation/secretion protein